MALRGKKPELIEKRLKMFIYGPAGCGKTTLAISMPAPYVIDTEKGAENESYSKLISDNSGCIFQTSDFNDVLTEVRSLLSEKHDYKTLVIDPMSIVYSELVARMEDKVGSAHGRNYGEANKAMVRLLQLILRLDMNVVITSHAKNEYASNMSVVGSTFDCYKKIDYLFDLVLSAKIIEGERMATICKSRMAEFPVGETFLLRPEEVMKRYGYEMFEKNSVAIKIIEKERAAHLEQLVFDYAIQNETVERWLKKAGVSSIYDMDEGSAEKCIKFIENKEGNLC